MTEYFIEDEPLFNRYTNKIWYSKKELEAEVHKRIKQRIKDGCTKEEIKEAMIKCEKKYHANYSRLRKELKIK